jgi:hypothetical protein
MSRVLNFFKYMLVAFLCAAGISCNELPEAPEYDLPEEDVQQPQPENDEFVILFTNDFHSQIEPLGQEETYNAGRG